MKKYNQLIILSIVFWLLASFVSGYSIRKQEMQRDTQYKVEINRLYSSMSKEGAFDKEYLNSCKWVKGATFLSCNDIKLADKTKAFYETDNNWEMEVRPLYDKEQLVGFVRFDYERASTDNSKLFWIVQIVLFFMEGVLLVALFYVKNKVIKPFRQIRDVPTELAKGHFKGIMKEEKNKFLGQFMWGIGQLKDSLDVSKKRTLQLEKEKKTLLLSLSHDIKTPLNTIKLYAKALEDGVYKEDVQKIQAAHQIGEKTVEIGKYVEEIMKHSREEILDIQVCKREFYLKELVEKVLSTYREKCALRLVELHVQEYEDRILDGDIDRAMEVFENIFENAFKYGDGRRIEISFWEEEDCQLIRIFNTGEPVSENDYNHIFESFFRAANSDGQQGNGLGLYICREIMRKMGGSIYAERLQDGMAFVLVFQ